MSKVRDEWTDPTLGKTTFGEYAAGWLTTNADVGPRTVVNIEGRLRNHVLPFFGQTQLARIQPTHVRGWVAGLSVTGLAPATGAGELEALKVARLHPLEGTIEVVESLTEVGGRMIIGPTKTGRPRTIGVPRLLAQLLGEHVGAYPSAAGCVFTAGEGGPVRHRNFMARHYKPALVAAGLQSDVRFHDLRHTCAALLIASGRQMHEVKDHLGRSTIRVTSDRCGHLFPQARQAVADALDALDATFTDAGSTATAGVLRLKGNLEAGYQ